MELTLNIGNSEPFLAQEDEGKEPKEAIGVGFTTAISLEEYEQLLKLQKQWVIKVGVQEPPKK